MSETEIGTSESLYTTIRIKKTTREALLKIESESKITYDDRIQYLLKIPLDLSRNEQEFETQ